MKAILATLVSVAALGIGIAHAETVTVTGGEIRGAMLHHGGAGNWTMPQSV